MNSDDNDAPSGEQCAVFLIMELTRDKQKLMKELALQEKMSEDEEDDDASSKKREGKEEMKLIEKIEEDIN